ncbi:MAG TPA: hypothetical protein VFO60_09910, partial [Candidatus Dormibacteraeota bacterium]|nr:hypothetical protein [Candidatus Dormibacteraeota bacterium]
MPMVVSSVTDSYPASAYAPETLVTLDSTDFVNGPFCNANSTPTCSVDSHGTLSVGPFALLAGASHTFRYIVIAVGSERGCGNTTRTSTATNAFGTSTDSGSALVCDA